MAALDVELASVQLEWFNTPLALVDIVAEPVGNDGFAELSVTVTEQVADAPPTTTVDGKQTTVVIVV